MARVPEGFTNQWDSPSHQGGVYHGKYQLLITGIYPATIAFTEPKCGLPPQALKQPLHQQKKQASRLKANWSGFCHVELR